MLCAFLFCFVEANAVKLFQKISDKLVHMIPINSLISVAIRILVPYN